MKGIVSRETITTATVSNDTRQQALFTGEIQPGIPNSESSQVSERIEADKRSHDSARQKKSRKKAKDQRLIQAVVTQTGFYNHQLTRRVYVHYDSNIWDSTAYNRDYYQEAAKVIFTGYVPTLRDFLLLLVVRISNQKASSTLPLINYLTKPNHLPNHYFCQAMDEMGISSMRDEAR